MQLRWRKIWLLSFWATAVILVALAVSVIFSAQQKSTQAPAVSTATESTLYKEVKPVGISDPPITGEPPKVRLTPKEEEASSKAALQAAEDADAAAKR